MLTSARKATDVVMPTPAEKNEEDDGGVNGPVDDGGGGNAATAGGALAALDPVGEVNEIEVEWIEHLSMDVEWGEHLSIDAGVSDDEGEINNSDFFGCGSVCSPLFEKAGGSRGNCGPNEANGDTEEENEAVGDTEEEDSTMRAAYLLEWLHTTSLLGRPKHQHQSPAEAAAEAARLEAEVKALPTMCDGFEDDGHGGDDASVPVPAPAFKPVRSPTTAAAARFVRAQRSSAAASGTTGATNGAPDAPPDTPTDTPTDTAAASACAGLHFGALLDEVAAEHAGVGEDCAKPEKEAENEVREEKAHEVAFTATLCAMSIDAFDDLARAEFAAGVATGHGVPCVGVRVTGARAGSVVVETSVVVAGGAVAAAELASSLADPTAAGHGPLVDDSRFGRCDVSGVRVEAAAEAARLEAEAKARAEAKANSR